jgi:hypothetical protein
MTKNVGGVGSSSLIHNLQILFNVQDLVNALNQDVMNIKHETNNKHW